jgi:hypothetical protein
MAPAAVALLGPPIALKARFADPNKPKLTAAAVSSEQDDSNYSSDSSDDMHMPARKKLLATSGDPCVDFFFQIVPGVSSAADVAELLDAAWSHNPEAALKVVCHLRGVRGLGKADRQGFYGAALWMHRRHPKTLAGNLSVFARFGCLKDLPEILYRVLHGPREDKGDEKWERGGSVVRGVKRRRPDRAAVAEARREEEARLAQAVLALYGSDEKFCLLYDSVAETFAELLRSDHAHLRAGSTA